MTERLKTDWRGVYAMQIEVQVLRLFRARLFNLSLRTGKTAKDVFSGGYPAKFDLHPVPFSVLTR